MPGSNRNSPGRQNGVVLVLVLVILMGLSSLVISQLKRSSEGVLATASLPPEYETGFRAEAALQIVQEMLRRDRDQYADTRAEPWLEPLELDGLSIRISPCNARINLNAIDEQRTEDAVSRLLPATDNAQRVAALKCWVNPELLKQLPLFRRPNYDDTDPHYVSRGGELQTPGELRLVDGFHDVDPEWVRSRFTVWSENKLNLNFASREAITAYLPELAPFLDEIMNRAKVQGFTHISQLLDVTGMSPGGDDYQQVIQHATVSSHLFRAVVVARAGGCVLTKRYILQRNPLRLDEPPQLVRQDNLSVTLTGF